MDQESEKTVENLTDENSSVFKKDFYSNTYSSYPHDKEKEKLDAEQYR